MPPQVQSPRSTPESQNLVFSPGTPHILGLDHTGAHVVADADGSGLAAFKDPLAPGLCAEIDEAPPVPVTTLTVPFQTSIRILADSPSLTPVNILFAPSEIPANLEAPLLTDPQGPGYLFPPLPTDPATQVIIDDSHTPLDLTGLLAPLPVFLQIKGGPCRFLPDPTQTVQLIDRFPITDPEALKARDWQVQNISEPALLDSVFPDDTPHQALKASHLNRAHWTAQIPPENNGLILHKTYDRFHGRQRARILIDGLPIGWWSDPYQNRISRWSRLSFGIPAKVTQGKTQIRLTVDPPAGVPLWDVSEYALYALLPCP